MKRQLGEVKHVIEKFEGYQQEEKIRNDAEFVEGLSADVGISNI